MLCVYLIEFIVLNVAWALACAISISVDRLTDEIKIESFWEKVWSIRWWLLVSYSAFALVVYQGVMYDLAQTDAR